MNLPLCEIIRLETTFSSEKISCKKARVMTHSFSQCVRQISNINVPQRALLSFITIYFPEYPSFFLIPTFFLLFFFLLLYSRFMNIFLMERYEDK